MANRLTATMVVDLQDKTGAKTRAIIGNMDKLKRAERDHMLADKGLRLSSKDRAMERLLMEKQRSVEERQASISRWAARGAVATVAVGLGAAKAYGDYASLERRINRIVINADKGTDAIQPTIDRLRKVSNDTAMPFQDVVDGLDALIAAGRSMDDALAFLPSVTMTAQASGAAVDDMAKSADALGSALEIDPSKMQQAFDILVASGKSGKFELKDMAQYLPSLTPAFAALGYKGTDGLRKLAAMLQVVRSQTGTSGEAATNLGNVLQKMYSEETAKKFAKMGIDITASLDKAKKDGKDILEVFMDATQAATKGDLSKLTLLFTDSEMQKGMRALITQRDLLKQFTNELKNVDGSSLKDFNQIAGDSAGKIQRLSNNWDAFVKKVGAGVATVANPVLETVNKEVDDTSARMKASAGLDREQRQWQRQDYEKKYKELHPEAWWFQINAARMEDEAKVGRGEQSSIMDRLNLEAARRQGGAQTAKFPSRGAYKEGLDLNPLGASTATHNAPVPMPRAQPETAASMREGQIQAAQEQQARYPSRGSYDASPGDATAQWLRDRQRKKDMASLGSLAMDTFLPADSPPQGPALPFGSQPANGNALIPDASFWDGFKRFMLGAAADPNFNAKDHFGIQTKAAGESGPQSVTLSGTPSVTITNPPPRPNISITMPVTITGAENTNAVAQQLGNQVREAMDGLQASTNDSGL